MSTQFVVRGALAAAVVVAIPLCLMLPGTRPHMPAPRLPQKASLIPFGTLPGQPIPARLSPDDGMPITRPANMTLIEIDYREPISGGDQNAARDRVYAEVQKDCDAAAAQFHKSCSVGQVAFDWSAPGSSADSSILHVHARLRLTGVAP